MKCIPFVTQNTKLAQALQAVGFILLDIWNVYDDRTLTGLKRESAKSAFDAGLPGAISYFFEHSDQLAAVLAAWDDMGAQIKSGEYRDVDASAEDIARIGRMFLDHRAEFAALWKSAVPRYMEQKGEITRDISGRRDDGTPYEGAVSMPGFSMVTIDASAKTRQRVNL